MYLYNKFNQDKYAIVIIMAKNNYVMRCQMDVYKVVILLDYFCTSFLMPVGADSEILHDIVQFVLTLCGVATL